MLDQMQASYVEKQQCIEVDRHEDPVVNSSMDVVLISPLSTE